MLKNCSKFLFAALFLVIGFFSVNAQTDASGNTNKEDYPDNIKESFAKQRIKAEQKDFDEMLDRSQEIAKISDELFQSYEKNQKLTADDSKKAERLEKLVKKVRDELGSEGGDNDAAQTKDSMPSFDNALKIISETSTNLFAELKKQGRFGISVVAVESSNTLLKLVRFVRQRAN